MPPHRAKRHRKEEPSAFPPTAPSLAEIARRAAAEATARWLEAARGGSREAAVRAIEETAPIVARHWSGMLDRLWGLCLDPSAKADPQALQRRLHLATVTSVNEMLKELMGTPSFASLSGRSLESSLRAKIAADGALEHWLRAGRIPTRADVDGLRAELLALSIKVDRLLEPGAEPGARGG
jgi:hypothetical protein